MSSRIVRWTQFDWTGTSNATQQQHVIFPETTADQQERTPSLQCPQISVFTLVLEPNIVFTICSEGEAELSKPRCVLHHFPVFGPLDGHSHCQLTRPAFTCKWKEIPGFHAEQTLLLWSATESECIFTLLRTAHTIWSGPGFNYSRPNSASVSALRGKKEYIHPSVRRLLIQQKSVFSFS